jgi:hypothetical protein
MAICDVVIKKETVKLGGSAIDLRGLSTYDIQTIVAVSFESIIGAIKLYDTFDKNGSDALSDPAALQNYFGLMLSQFPQLVATIICVAADENDQVQKVMKFPVGFQILCLKHIGALTFSEVGGLKKLIEQGIEALALAQEELKTTTKTASNTGLMA